MSYLDNSSELVSAVITDFGKNILAATPTKFKITRYSFSDDEIDYSLAISAITATQVPQPNVSSSAFSDFIKTLPREMNRVANITLDPSTITIDAGTIISVNISTDILTESLGYTVYLNSNNITIEAIDTVDNIKDASKVSIQIVSDLTSADLSKFSKFENVTRIFNMSSIICKTAFQIKAKNVFGKYLLVITGNNSRAKQELEVHVKV
jgi:hypothetical protein